jgi:TIR domain
VFFALFSADREGIGMAGGVFISYRREDSSQYARAISDRLANRLGRENVFFDLNSIGKGLDFVNALTEALGKSFALLAVIGRDWVSGAENLRRLADPTDYVRLEIQTALGRDVRVIPVLVGRGTMPKRDDLPDCLKDLTRRNGTTISDEHFESDVDDLITALSKALEELREREAARRGEEERMGREAAWRAEEERKNKAKEQLLSSIDIAFTADEFNELVLMTFGEDLYDKYVSDRLTSKNLARSLVDELKVRGVLPQFLRAVRIAKPGSEQLLQAIDEYCPSAAKSDEPDNDKIQTVKTALETILRIVQKNKVLRDSELLSLARNLKKLQAYKTLHDVLQRVQLERYPYILPPIKRLGDDPTVADELSPHIDALGRLCVVAGKAVEGLKDIGASFGPERSWIQTLSSAVKNLEAAVEKFDSRAARGATLIIRQVLSQQPARMDDELRKTAQSLPLDNLVLTISKVASVPGLSETESGVVNLAKVKLESLHGDLGGRVAVHNRWQDVENQLWSADNAIEGTPPTISEEFELLWENANSIIAPLWNLAPSAQWVVETRVFSAEVDALLKATPVNAQAVKKKYQLFRKEAVKQFFEVDASLKSFCDQILDLGAPVDILLAQLSDG